ncbi:MAG: S-layer protein [Candidatus Methanofastidiosia archaeon]
MRLKKVGAILAGTALLSSALAGAVAAADLPPKSFFINEDGTPAVLIVVGEESAASDVVAASLVAAKIGTMAVKIERVELPGQIFAAGHNNIPLMQQVWDAGIWSNPGLSLPAPNAYINAPVDPNYVYGVTVVDVPDSNAYAASTPQWQPPMIQPTAQPHLSPIPSFYATPVYTLPSLWWFDDVDAGFFGDRDDPFDAWEIHEEIQIRFDNLFLFDPRTGGNAQDNLADIVGGDVDHNLVLYTNNLDWEADWGLDPRPEDDRYYMRLEPGLNYRIDNVRRPIQQELCWDYLWHKVTGQEIVDLHQQFQQNLYIPEPNSIVRHRLPKIKVFGKEYTVVDATFLWDWNRRTASQDPQWNLGQANIWAGEYVVITGTPTSYVEEYIYKDEPKTYAGYEVTVNDIDVDHNKAWITVTEPTGDTNDVWMILDPEHGFSPGLQQMGVTGGFPFVGRGLNDVLALTNLIEYIDDLGDRHYQYEYPVFAMDGIATFIGANGTTGILVNIYTLEDIKEFKTQNCCIPFVEEPSAYALWIDQQVTMDPVTGVNFPFTYPISPTIPYNGVRWTIDANAYDRPAPYKTIPYDGAVGELTGSALSAFPQGSVFLYYDADADDTYDKGELIVADLNGANGWEVGEPMVVYGFGPLQAAAYPPISAPGPGNVGMKVLPDLIYYDFDGDGYYRQGDFIVVDENLNGDWDLTEEAIIGVGQPPVLPVSAATPECPPTVIVTIGMRDFYEDMPPNPPEDLSTGLLSFYDANNNGIYDWGEALIYEQDPECTVDPPDIFFAAPNRIYDDTDVMLLGHLILDNLESVPGNPFDGLDNFADRDFNDFAWLFEDCNLPAYDIAEPPIPPLPPAIQIKGEWPLTFLDYMWEMNIKLCDTFELVRCTTKYIFDGPNHYFKIDLTDISWDDNNDGIRDVGAWLDPDPLTPGDETWQFGFDDGIDFKTIMEISAGSYDRVIQVDIDEASLVKLDIEITDMDKALYNLIMIGGPVHNLAVRELVDLGIFPDDGSPVDWMYTSAGDYKLYTNPYGTGKDVLVVAGADREATRLAAEQLVANL